MPRSDPTGHDPRHGEHPSRRITLVLGVVVPVVLVIGAAAWWQTSRRGPVHIVIATGTPGGTYHPLGRGLADLIGRDRPGSTVRVIESGGSDENIQRLQRREADFAFVQNDAHGDNHVRVVASLYDEVLQVIVRNDRGIDGLDDLRHRRINVGTEGGGTRRIAEGLLRHFDLGPDAFEASTLDPTAASAALLDGRIDAACFLSGLRTEAVDGLLGTGRTRLLALGDAARPGSALEGLRVEMPFVEPTLIPARTYGARPPRAVGTVAVEALLVTRRDVPDALVHDVTRLLFTNKVALAEYHPVAGRLDETRDAQGLRFPLHDGAAAYHRRDEPSALVAYAPAMSFAFSVLLAMGSFSLGLREWLRRTKKNRIDVYYLAVQKAAVELATADSDAALDAVRARLIEIEADAFRGLIAERLEASASFLIFQTLLNAKLREIDQRRWNSDRADRA